MEDCVKQQQILQLQKKSDFSPFQFVPLFLIDMPTASVLSNSSNVQ